MRPLTSCIFHHPVKFRIQALKRSVPPILCFVSFRSMLYSGKSYRSLNHSCSGDHSKSLHICGSRPVDNWMTSFPFVPSFDGWYYEAYAFSLRLTMGQRMPAPYRPYSFELRSSGHVLTRLQTADFDRSQPHAGVLALVSTVLLRWFDTAGEFHH